MLIFGYFDELGSNKMKQSRGFVHLMGNVCKKIQTDLFVSFVVTDRTRRRRSNDLLQPISPSTINKKSSASLDKKSGLESFGASLEPCLLCHCHRALLRSIPADLHGEERPFQVAEESLPTPFLIAQPPSHRSFCPAHSDPWKAGAK